VTPKEAYGLFRTAFTEFQSDRAQRLAAALAYYALFSIAPLLVIAVAIAGFAFGEEAARGEIVSQIRGVVGENGGKAIEEMVENAGKKEEQGVLATVFGLAALFFGASGVFAQLKDTMNTIWAVDPKKIRSGIMGLVFDRLLSFAMVLTVGFLLLVSLVISAGIAAIGQKLAGEAETIMQIGNAVVSLGVITVLFALIFKYVPDAKIRWSDVWIGAAFTSALFVIGKFAIGLYLGKSSVASTYGAAASLIIIILWLYYSGLILFFGAEFTEVYARRHTGAESREERATGKRSGPPQLPSRGPLSMSLPLPQPSRKARKRSGGVGAPIAAGLGGLAVGCLLGVFGVAIAAVKGVTRVFR
jgi:membrane protein